MNLKKYTTIFDCKDIRLLRLLYMYCVKKDSKNIKYILLIVKICF